MKDLENLMGHKILNAHPVKYRGKFTLFNGEVLNETGNKLIPVQVWAYDCIETVDCYLSRTRQAFTIHYL